MGAVRAERRNRALVIALVVFAGFLVLRPYLYTLVLWPLLAKQQAWEGRVVEQFEKRYGPYGLSTFHWRVACEDGKTRTCDVPSALYLTVRPGAEVRKQRGERWPRPVGPPNGATLLQEQMGESFPEQLKPLVPVER